MAVYRRKYNIFRARRPKRRQMKRRILRRKSTRNSLRRFPRGLPNQFRTKLSYAFDKETLSGDNSATEPTDYLSINMNGIYDPDPRTGGYSPPLFDNYMAIYRQWRVNSCRVTATLTSYSDVPMKIYLVGLYDPSTNSPTIPLLMSSYNVAALSSRVRSSIKTLGTVSADSGTQLKLSKKFYPRNFVSQDYFTSVNFVGDSGSNPARMPIVAVCAASQGNGTQAWGAWLNVSVEYDVTFFNRIATETALYD